MVKVILLVKNKKMKFCFFIASLIGVSMLKLFKFARPLNMLRFSRNFAWVFIFRCSIGATLSLLEKLTLKFYHVSLGHPNVRTMYVICNMYACNMYRRTYAYVLSMSSTSMYCPRHCILLSCDVLGVPCSLMMHIVHRCWMVNTNYVLMFSV